MYWPSLPGIGAVIDIGAGAAFVIGAGAVIEAGEGAVIEAGVAAAFVIGVGAMETALGARDCMAATSCPGWAPELVSFTLSLNSASEGKEGVAARLGADTGCEETGAVTG